MEKKKETKEISIDSTKPRKAYSRPVVPTVAPFNVEPEQKEQMVERKELDVSRGTLTLTSFFDDMNRLGAQVRNAKDKPTFHYGDLGITNYLLWNLLGEIMMLNNKLKLFEKMKE